LDKISLAICGCVSSHRRQKARLHGREQEDRDSDHDQRSQERASPRRLRRRGQQLDDDRAGIDQKLRRERADQQQSECPEERVACRKRAG